MPSAVFSVAAVRPSEQELAFANYECDRFAAQLRGIDRLHFNVIALLQVFAQCIATVSDQCLPFLTEEIYTSLDQICNEYKCGFQVFVDFFWPEVETFYALEVELASIDDHILAEIRRKKLLIELVKKNLGLVFGQVVQRRGMEHEDNEFIEYEESSDESGVESEESDDDSGDNLIVLVDQIPVNFYRLGNGVAHRLITE
ncbi:unnamed protein product [Caenorhabditis bovis]|uniref:Uncharacterized protein n=1 Tax=Caenorhabditis bovis TaxID=2654633 RepID=A0A8S1FCR1_9PELO|nr:unnamed protein product [Caenorhabditis bovis]